jgi:hypothetical protein
VVIDGTLPAALGLALGIDQARVTAPLSGSLPEPEKWHVAPLHPEALIVAFGEPLATDNEY